MHRIHLEGISSAISASCSERRHRTCGTFGETMRRLMCLSGDIYYCYHGASSDCLQPTHVQKICVSRSQSCSKMHLSALRLDLFCRVYVRCKALRWFPGLDTMKLSHSVHSMSFIHGPMKKEWDTFYLSHPSKASPPHLRSSHIHANNQNVPRSRPCLRVDWIEKTSI